MASPVLNGTSDVIKAALDAARAMDTDWTVFVEWTSPATLQNGYVFGFHDSGTSSASDGVFAYFGDPTVWLGVFDATNGDTWPGSGGDWVSANTAYRIALTHVASSDTVTLYWDIEAQSQTVTPSPALPANADEIILGAIRYNGGDQDYQSGSYKDMAFWASVLSSNDIQDLLDNGKVPNHADIAPPTQYWPLATNYNPAIGTAVATGPAFPAALGVGSSPTTLERGGPTGDIVVSNPATAPTGPNTTVRIGGPTGPVLNKGTITGSDPYTIPVSVPLAAAIQNQAGLTFHIDINGETVSGGSCELVEEAGYDDTNLSSPNTASDTSILYGYTGDTPVTGDQVVFESSVLGTVDDVADQPITVTVAADGIVTFDGGGVITGTVAVDRYVIQANGTIGANADYTYDFGSGADTTPDQFTFSDVASANLSTPYENIQFITGVDAGETLSVTGGQLSNDGTNWVSSLAFSSGNTRVRAQITSSASYSTQSDQVVTVNGVSDTFSVTTKADPSPVITGPSSPNVVEATSQTISYTITERNGQLPTLTGTNAALYTMPLVSGDTFALTPVSPHPAAPATHNVTININDGVNPSVTLAVAVNVVAVSSGTSKPGIFSCAFSSPFSGSIN